MAYFCAYISMIIPNIVNVFVFSRLVLEKHHQQNMATKHIAIETWLEALGMIDYLPVFANYTGVEVNYYRCQNLFCKFDPNSKANGYTIQCINEHLSLF